ncbi:MAG TPA: efflux RND transporter periplasmic adaptor subunit [Terracidiphilus sp.]|jgi:HlyD family secretion protein
MAQERKQLGWRWAWLGAAIILVLVFMSVRSMTRTRLEVRVAQATHQQLSSTISTNGRVEPLHNYTIPCPISTTVKAVLVQPGDQVTAGKLLMVLDDVQARARLAAAQAAVKNAQAAVEAATHNGTLEQQQATAAEVTRAKMERERALHDLDAMTKLNATGAASASEVASARQRVATANATLEAAQTSSKGRYSPAEIDRAKSGLDEAEANLVAAQQVEAQTQVRAPAPGTVYSIEVKPTDFVEQGKLLLQLADLRQERVRAYFDEPEIGSLAVGQPIEIKWDARPGRVWHGHIERLPYTVMHLDTRTVGEVPVTIDDPDGDLLPDTNVTVTVTTSSQPNALSVSKEALHMENGKPFVFKIVGDELKRTPVVTGAFNLTQQAILSGLSDGDWVATGTTNGQPLQEGVPIKEIK